MREKWAQDIQKREIRNTQKHLDNYNCPVCTERFRGEVVKVVRIKSFPRRGDGYLEIVGCPNCKRVFFIDHETP